MDQFAETSEPIQTGMNSAEKAATISRTILTRPDAMAYFKTAFQLAVKNGQERIKLTPNLYARYSEFVTKGKSSDQYDLRYMDARAKKRTAEIISKLYENINQEGGLTLESLAEFYDQITLREPLLDSNTRTSTIALTHILSQYQYPPPDFSGKPRDLLQTLQKQYPTKLQAAVEFLRIILPVSPPSQNMINPPG